MLESLKKQPLLGLTLAVAGGLVLARVVIAFLRWIYVDYFGADPGEAFPALALVVVTVGLFFRFRRPIWNFIGRRKWQLASAIVVVGIASVYVLHRNSEIAERTRAIYERQAEDAAIARAAANYAASHSAKPGARNPYDVIADEDAHKQK